MKISRTFLLLMLLGIAGAALLITLLVRHGIADITGAVAAAGWGVAAVILFHLVPLFLDVLGWRALIPSEHRLSLARLFTIRWIGDSVSSMLPVAQVGGEVVRVRLASAPCSTQSMPLSIAAASVLVGMTLSVATQILFTLSGLAALLVVTGRNALFGPVLAVSLIGVAAVGGFYAVQRLGIFRIIGAILNHITRADHWRSLVKSGETLDHDVRVLYARRRSLMASSLWTMGTWATGAVEVWIALWALGAPATYAQAYILESTSQAIRSAMFLVPGALGVQEGGYLVVGGLLGLSPETSLALALIRRARELAFGLPGLIAWQWLEGRRLWRRRAPAEKPSLDLT